MRSYPLAAVAELIADPGRAAMLMALLDCSSRPASELAQIASVSQQSASMHLSKLLQGGLLTVVSQGRHRYYRLASAEVANALEALGTIGSASVPANKNRLTGSELRILRTCYDHMAGMIAVGLSEKLCERRILSFTEDQRDFIVTHQGERWFCNIGIDCSMLKTQSRCFAYRCLDWTERRYHIGGALGAALLDHFLVRKLVAAKGGTRALRITARGADVLSTFGVNVDI